MATCTCRACRLGHDDVVLSLTDLARHLSMTADDLRATIKAGEGPPPFKPAHRRYPRYYLPAVKAWIAGRNDRGAA